MNSNLGILFVKRIYKIDSFCCIFLEDIVLTLVCIFLCLFLLQKPQRLSARDRELLVAKVRIENAPVAKDNHLYAPIFQNVSKFRR